MKKKLVEKTYFSKGKLIISYLLLVLLLNGCSKNDSIEVLTQDETINSSFVNFNEFENAVGKDVIAIVTKRIAFHNTEKFSGKNAFSNYLVDTDKIVKSTKGSYVSYTFPVISKNSEKEILKNIIFEKENDDFKAYLLTYKPDLQYITNKKKHKRVKFSGILIKQDLDSNLIWEADISNYEAKSNHKSKTSDCDIFIREFWETGSGEICEFDGQGIDCDEVGCHEVIEITIWCHGGGGDNGGSDGNNDGDNSGGNNDGGMTGGGGGNDSGGSGSGGNSTITTPINPDGTSAVVDILTNFLLLTPEQSNYLTNNTTIANEIFDFLEQNSSIDNKNFSKELIDILRFEGTVDNNALSFILKAKNEDKIYNPFDSSFLSSVNQYMNIDATATNPGLIQLQLYFSTQCAVLRYNHPTWSDTKIYWEASKEFVHIALDGFGMIPVVGEIADLTNGVLYLVEGDGVNATLSFAATVPIVGSGATTGKYVFKITASTLGTKVRLTWKVLQDGTVYFGSNSTCRRQLRKALGLAPYAQDARQAHHIIPLNLQTNPVVQNAARSENAFHLNEVLNGIPLDNTVHNGSHFDYDGKIAQKFVDFLEDTPNPTPNECYDVVVNIINDIRTAITNNPNTHINLLDF